MRWLKVIRPAVGTVLAIIGLAGVTGDLEVWWAWLKPVRENPWPWVVLILGLALLLADTPIWAPIRRRFSHATTEIDATTAASEQNQPRAAKQSVEPPATAPAQPQPPIRRATGRVVVTPEQGPMGSNAEIAMGGGRILRSGETVRIFFGDSVVAETTVGPGYFYGFRTVIPRMEPGPYVVRAVGMESHVEMLGRFTVTEPIQDETSDE